MRIEGHSAVVTGGGSCLVETVARDRARHGVRVCSTPLKQQLPPEVQHSLAASIPFPRRLGAPAEFASLATHIVTNSHLNGEVIRLDGALRMAPR